MTNYVDAGISMWLSRSVGGDFDAETLMRIPLACWITMWVIHTHECCILQHNIFGASQSREVSHKCLILQHNIFGASQSREVSHFATQYFCAARACCGDGREDMCMNLPLVCEGGV